MDSLRSKSPLRKLHDEYLIGLRTTFLCSVCEREKPFHLLYDPNMGVGQFILCKSCAAKGKHCPICKEYKVFAEFPKSTNSTNRGGVAGMCKPCKRDYGRQRYDPEKHRAYNLRQHHNLSQEEYEQMFLVQFGLCAICGNAETAKDRNGKIKPLCVDHDHGTGKNRELLCQECNMLLGQIEKDPKRFKAIRKYLKKHDM